MEFTFETIYDQKAMKAMANALRKTVRKKRSRRSHIWGLIVCFLGLLLTLIPGENGLVINFKTILTWIIVGVIIVVLIWEDAINGYIAGKRMLKGTEASTTIFNEEGYVSTTEFGKTEWNYEKISELAENDKFFVFIFSMSHAQVYDKGKLSGGTIEEFRTFIQRKTNKQISMI